MIRPATVYDVPRIQEIINSHAELGRMLFKSLAQLYEDLRDFAVYEEDGQILGCVGLTIIWADLAEVRSLAVDGNHQGRGIGKQLVDWTFSEARRLHIRKLMSLTYEQRFFEKLGFEVVSPPPRRLPKASASPSSNMPRRINVGPALPNKLVIASGTAGPFAIRDSKPKLTHHDSRKSLLLDRISFGPDDRHPGLSLTSPQNRSDEKNSNRKWAKSASGTTRRPPSPSFMS